MRGLPREIDEALHGLTEPWEIKIGGKHIKILVRGQLAGVLPLNRRFERDKRSTLNILAQIRRVARTGQAARRG